MKGNIWVTQKHERKYKKTEKRKKSKNKIVFETTMKQSQNNAAATCRFAVLHNLCNIKIKERHSSYTAICTFISKNFPLHKNEFLFLDFFSNA